MKIFIFRAGTIVGILLMAVTACQKSSSPETGNTYTDQVNMLVDNAGASMDKQEAFTDEATHTIYMLNDGISPEFLADEDCMGDDPSKSYIRDHSFIRCLKGLSLSETQLPAVKQSLRTYKICCSKAVKRARALYLELKEKYQVSYQRLYAALQNGSITREEFKRKVEALRVAFKKELRRMHLKEKLDEALKQCLRECFGELHGILSERQWNAFIECCKR